MEAPLLPEALPGHVPEPEASEAVQSPLEARLEMLEAEMAVYAEAAHQKLLIERRLANDPHVAKAREHLEAAKLALDALLQTYQTEARPHEETMRSLRERLVESWPDPTRKTIRGNAWQVQRRVTAKIVVKDLVRGVRFFSEKGLLDMAIKSVTWDGKFLGLARDKYGPHGTDGRLLLAQETTTSIAITLDEVA